MAADKTELRGLVSNELAAAIDAIAMARGMDRITFVVSILDREVKSVCHEAIFLHRTLRGNPYLVEPDGAHKE